MRVFPKIRTLDSIRHRDTAKMSLDWHAFFRVRLQLSLERVQRPPLEGTLDEALLVVAIAIDAASLLCLSVFLPH